MSPQKKIPKHFIITLGNPGMIEHVTASTALDMVYENMFKQAEKRVLRNPAKIEYGIQAILFGCFWIEALSNSVAQDVLWRSLAKHPLRDVVWKQTKRSNIFEKLDLIETLCTEQETKQLQLLKPRLKKSFGLRNRLAHFRVEEESITKGPAAFEQIFEIMETAPDTELITMLTTLSALTEHANTIRESAHWLGTVRSSK